MDTNGERRARDTGLRFKDGPYLTRKVERLMLQIARGKPAGWIAGLYDVRESLVHYVARKTGFPAGTLRSNDAAARKARAAEAILPGGENKPIAVEGDG